MSLHQNTKIQQKSWSSFDQMTHLYQYWLRFFVILPFNNQNYTSMANRALLLFSLVCTILQGGAFVTYTYHETRGLPSLDSITETVVIVGIIIRYYLLLANRHEFALVFDECRSIWNELCESNDECSRSVHYFERKVRRLFKGILGNLLFCSTIYVSIAVIATLQAINNGEDNRYLMLKWYTSPDNLWLGYKATFALQFVITMHSDVIAASVDTAAPLLIMIGAGYFRALRHRLSSLDDLMATNTQLDDRHIVACWRLHQRILIYCSRIDRITRSMFFVQLMCTGYNMSLIGIKLAGTDPDRLKYITVGCTCILQLFICQWAPDCLIDESKAISTAAYSVSTPWMKRRIGKLMVLMIARAQRPVQMSAAGMVYLSLQNFGAVLKGALSFFTVLRSFAT